MKKQFILIAICYLAINLVSCSKDTTEEVIPPTNKELLSSKSWVVKTKTIAPSISMGGFDVSDILSLESEEVRKYSFKYNTDGSLFLYDGSNNLIFQTTWSINSLQNLITFGQPIIYTYPIVGDLGITTFNLQLITKTQMTATIPFTYEGTNYVVTVSFN